MRKDKTGCTAEGGGRGWREGAAGEGQKRGGKEREDKS